jgi:hypothetical protein
MSPIGAWWAELVELRCDSRGYCVIAFTDHVGVKANEVSDGGMIAGSLELVRHGLPVRAFGLDW